MLPPGTWNIFTSKAAAQAGRAQVEVAGGGLRCGLEFATGDASNAVRNVVGRVG